MTMKAPKDFEDFLSNAWPHLVAKVDVLAWLVGAVLAAVIGGAIAIIVTGG